MADYFGNKFFGHRHFGEPYYGPADIADFVPTFGLIVRGSANPNIGLAGSFSPSGLAGSLSPIAVSGSSNGILIVGSFSTPLSV